MSDLAIVYLADRPDLIPMIAAWQYREWGHLAPGDSVEKRVEKLRGHLNRDRIPMTFAAVRGSDAVGSASLVEHDLPTRMDLSPWLASVVVVPEYRRRGIGSALVRRVVREAGRLQSNPLFLFTWDQEKLYAGLGWRIRERSMAGDTSIVIMEINPEVEGGES